MDEDYSEIWWDPDSGAERHRGNPRCSGACLRGYDILYPSDGIPSSVLAEVAYPHSQCPLHGDVEPWPDEQAAAEAQEQQRASLMLAYVEGRTF